MPAKRKDRRPDLPPTKHRESDQIQKDGEGEYRPRGVMVARSSFVGPMPPPELVAEYEEILPGAAKYFFSALERQSMHRQSLETKVVEANIGNERVGMWLAFLVAIAMIACGTFLIYEDKDPQGLSMIAGTLVALCGVFVYSRRQERKELQEKNPEKGG